MKNINNLKNETIIKAEVSIVDSSPLYANYLFYIDEKYKYFRLKNIETQNEYTLKIEETIDISTTIQQFLETIFFNVKIIW